MLSASITLLAHHACQEAIRHLHVLAPAQQTVIQITPLGEREKAANQHATSQLSERRFWKVLFW